MLRKNPRLLDAGCWMLDAGSVLDAEKKGGEGLTPALITPEEVVISFLQLSFWWLSSL